ncbi:cilia- and flagella-associated protein 251-like isoform X18 [Hippocampus zosterae]|uniref:cilia- and flagella-associated protein 251-like isoform X18 n=1 Tax=Hippocampus zosterae TaxID=109293 RepID=UPI00223CF12E|nr:cilia- and flagella-associated protein 251-like isoform X18 [Hippocampus zosterae]
MCSRTSEYEEELCGEKEDHKGQRQPLDAIGRMQPRVLHRLDISKDVCPERLGAEPSHIKEEEEKKEVSYLKEQQEQQAHYIKEEELEYPCTKAEVEEPRDIREDVCPKRLDAEPSHIKEGEEKKEVSFKEEEEQQTLDMKKEEEQEHPCMKDSDTSSSVEEEEEEEEDEESAEKCAGVELV